MNKRLLKAKEELEKERLDAILVSSVPNITYLISFSNFSKDEREAFLLITKDRQYILTDGRYSEEVEKSVSDFELVEISSSNPVDKILKNLIRKNKIKKLGLEKHNLTVWELEKFSFKPSMLKQQTIIEKMRAVKNDDEITAIEKACGLSDKAFDYILKKISPNITEKELAFEIEFFIKKQGADISFPPIVAFGKNSSVPHHQSSNQRLEARDQFVLLDFGVRLNNYCSDMTRTVFFGKPTSEQKRIYQTVLEAQKKAIEHLGGVAKQHLRGDRMGSSEVDSIKAKDIDKIARDYIVSKGYPTIPHSLGHGIGLEIHELPRLSPNSKDELKVGMVFSIEPGIYVQNLGGVRIEDLVVFESSGLPRQQAGPRLLTKSPKKMIIL